MENTLSDEHYKLVASRKRTGVPRKTRAERLANLKIPPRTSENAISDIANSFFPANPLTETENLFSPTNYLKKLDIELHLEAAYKENSNQNFHLEQQLFTYAGIECSAQGTSTLNIDQFVHALTKKVQAKIIGNQLFLYNYSQGYFELITTNDFHTIAKYWLDTLTSNVWSISLQKLYTESFFIEVKKYFSYRELKVNARYIAFENGTLDLLNLTLLPHNPDMNVFNHFNYEYDPTAICPLWENTLSVIFQGDSSVIESFREMFGSFLLHGEGCHFDKLFIFLGSGANGKSLCAKVIENVLTHQNCSATPFAKLSSRFALSSIYDKFVNISTENEQVIKDSSIFKQLTSGDSVEIESKYQDSFRAIPYTKLLCCSNNFPKFTDISYGMIRRVHIFEFNTRFVAPNKADLKKNEQIMDRNLEYKLKAERAGILNWALLGAQRLMKNNGQFQLPPAMSRLQENFIKETIPVQVFVSSCIASAPGNRIKTTDVLAQYSRWLNIHNFSKNASRTSQSFHSEFREALAKAELPYITKMNHGVDFYPDISIDITSTLQIPII